MSTTQLPTSHLPGQWANPQTIRLGAAGAEVQRFAVETPTGTLWILADAQNLRCIERTAADYFRTADAGTQKAMATGAGTQKVKGRAGARTFAKGTNRLANVTA